MQATAIRTGVAVLCVVGQVCHANPAAAPGVVPSSAAPFSHPFFAAAGCGSPIAIRLPAGIGGGGADALVLTHLAFTGCPFAPASVEIAPGAAASGAISVETAESTLEPVAAVFTKFEAADARASSGFDPAVREPMRIDAVPDDAESSLPAPSYSAPASTPAPAPALQRNRGSPPYSPQIPASPAPGWLQDVVLFLLIFVMVSSLVVFAAAMVIILRKHFFAPREVIARAARRGLKRDKFWLEYQPVFHVRSRQCFGVETQLRWRDSVHGRRGADWFMAQLGNSPVAMRLLRFTVETAAGELDHSATACTLPFIVNVPAACIADGECAVQLAELAKSLPHGRVVLQVSCEAFQHARANVGHLHHARANVRYLQDEGVHVSLSDVRSPEDAAGIAADGPLQFVRLHRGIMTFGEALRQRTLWALSTWGHECGIPIVADGVEAVGQYHAAGRARIGLVQGFFLCKAVGRGRLFDLLERQNAAKPLRTPDPAFRV